MLKFKLFKNGKVVGYMELQPRCCRNGGKLLWRYSVNGKTGWSGQARLRPDFDSVIQLKDVQ